MKKTSSALTGYQPETGDRVLCDPEYSLEDFDANKSPKPTIPANIIDVYKLAVLVEIIDEVKPYTGKRDFTNTDRYGSTCYVLSNAIIKAE